jgi:septum formation protein
MHRRETLSSFRRRASGAKKPIVRISPDRPLVLGSASPRRRELIALLDVPVVVRVPTVDESQLPGEPPDAYLERVTLAKLEAIRALGGHAASGVLVADTIVVDPCGAVLGKPADDDDARAMIVRLAGATHEVCTRFVLGGLEAGSRAEHAQTVATRVTFRPVSHDEVSAYVASGEGRDKAGGYAAQGRAAAFVQRIDGSYTNVVGLPLCEVVVALRGLGWL